MPRLKVKRCGLAEHYRRVYLVAPRHPESFWSLQGTVDLLGAKTLVPSSALATLIALTPSDVGVEFVLATRTSPRSTWIYPRPGGDHRCDGPLRLASSSSAAPFRRGAFQSPWAVTSATLQHDRCLGLADYHFHRRGRSTPGRGFSSDWIAGTARTGL